MCGRPFARARPRPRIVCAAVPSPARYGGRPVYFTDFAVRADSGFARLEDSFGGAFGWTTERSHSGWSAPRRHLLRRYGAPPERLYRKVVGPLVTPRAVIEAVADGRIDAGPVDSWFLDILTRSDPAAAGRIRVVETTPCSPIPPLVADRGIEDAALARMRTAFLGAAHDQAIAVALRSLRVDRFAVPEAAAYLDLR